MVMNEAFTVNLTPKDESRPLIFSPDTNQSQRRHTCRTSPDILCIQRILIKILAKSKTSDHTNGQQGGKIVSKQKCFHQHSGKRGTM